MTQGQETQESPMQQLSTFDVFAFFMFIFMPTWVSYTSNRQRFLVCLIINVLFGWTIIGWIVALLIANKVIFRPAVTRAFFNTKCDLSP